jgi:excisionase family DNA binding protein
MKPHSLPQRYVSLEDAAAYLSVSKVTLRRAIRDGRLHAKRMGRQLIRIDLRELDGLLRDIPSAAFDD